MCDPLSMSTSLWVPRTLDLEEIQLDCYWVEALDLTFAGSQGFSIEPGRQPRLLSTGGSQLQLQKGLFEGPTEPQFFNMCKTNALFKAPGTVDKLSPVLVVPPEMRELSFPGPENVCRMHLEAGGFGCIL